MALPLTVQAEALDIEEADAWLEYLDKTRGREGPRYLEVEPRAWSELRRRLRPIERRRMELRVETVVQAACNRLAQFIGRWRELDCPPIPLDGRSRLDAKWALSKVRAETDGDPFWDRVDWEALVIKVAMRLDDHLHSVGSSYRHFVSRQG